jgi:CubicO group peptidase (beta-lactamase class C family)
VTFEDVLPEIDALVDRFHASVVAPGCAVGVVVDGRLVHAVGRGTLRAGETRMPNPDSRFRIASMTKSFTAATVLRLRDDGLLRLDDEVAAWVPDLAELPPFSADSPPITIRSLLTMSSGLPTDDPWGDRQQSLDPEAFRRFLASGPLLAWPTGTQFEYANLGYAILGLVIAKAAAEPYRAAVERRILAPLGLTATTYDDIGIDPDELAHGHVRRDDAWIEEEPAGDGAFAPMGGLFSSVRDLATWVAQFTDAVPARDDPAPGAPLSRSTRREMQQVQRMTPPELTWKTASEAPGPVVVGYGYGLFVTLDVKRGRIVGHGGGYPGYGSYMCWHPATGIGVVGLANGRYARIWEVCRDALNLLVDRKAAPFRRPSPWAATVEARAAVEGLIDRWDDIVADRLFAMNVDLDEPLEARRAALDKLREVHGSLRPAPSEPVVSWSPAHLQWWLVGDRGRVRVEILLSPERPPRVQSLELTSVPDPPAPLAAVAEQVAALLGAPGPSWPADLALAEAIDRPTLDRELRAVEALFGPVVLGPALSGDGVKAASWRLRGPRGDVTLTLERDPADGMIRAISLVPATLESPVEIG